MDRETYQGGDLPVTPTEGADLIWNSKKGTLYFLTRVGLNTKSGQVPQEPRVVVLRAHVRLTYIVLIWHRASSSFPGQAQVNMLLARHLLSPHLILHLP